MKRLSQPSRTPGKRVEKLAEAKADVKRVTQNPEKVNKFENCDNLWKQIIFHNPVRKLKACL